MAKMFDLEDLGNNMKRIRKSKESRIKPGKPMFQYELAEISKIPASTLSNIENGKYKNPTWNILSKIAKGLDCEIRDFFVYQDRKVSPALIAISELVEMIIKEKFENILNEKIKNKKITEK